MYCRTATMEMFGRLEHSNADICLVHTYVFLNFPRHNNESWNWISCRRSPASGKLVGARANMDRGMVSSALTDDWGPSSLLAGMDLLFAGFILRWMSLSMRISMQILCNGFFCQTEDATWSTGQQGENWLRETCMPKQVPSGATSKLSGFQLMTVWEG